MTDKDRCPTCGHVWRGGAVREALGKMLKGRNPPTMAEAARRLGVSRQRVHQLAKEIGCWNPRRKRAPAGTKPEKETESEEPEAEEPAPVAKAMEWTSEPKLSAHEHIGQAVGGGAGVVRERCICGATRRVVYGEPEEWSEPPS